MSSLIALIIVIGLFGIIHYLSKEGYSFTIRVLVSTGLGVIVGLIFAGSTEYIAAIGTIYANLLKAIVVPVLFFSIISTISSLDDLKSLTSIGGKTIGVLSLHNILSSVIAIIVGVALKVGFNSGLSIPENAEVREVPTFIEAIIGFFPTNIVENAANNQIIPIIVFSLLVAIAILSYRDKKEIQAFTQFVHAGNKVVFNAVRIITSFTPYAVLALIADKVGGLDLASLTTLLLVLLAVYIACIFHSTVTTGLIIGLIGRLNPFIYLRKFLPVWLIAFSTQSSVGTIPANVEIQKEMGVPEKIASFAASIGTTFGMPGCAAIWPILLALFTINTLNIHFTLADYFYMIVVALLVSIGTIGVPGTATITATAMFTAIGLPVEMVIVLTPISAIADMARTATNVTAGGSTGLVVASLEGELDRKAYNQHASLIDNFSIQKH